MPKIRIRLIHWKAEEASARAEQLRQLGFQVNSELMDATGLRELRDDPPDAIVIDLSRMPSQGRDVGLGLRKHKATRRARLVFVGGAGDKVERVRKLLPDAIYTDWDRIGAALHTGLAAPLDDPIVPESVFAAYSGTPLPKKLGIKPGTSVALLGAPDDFGETLGDLPEDVALHTGLRQGCDVTLWFVRSLEELQAGIETIGAAAGMGRLWVIWPKKASKLASDLTQNLVRQLGLDAGLVDFKICAVDETWSALCFTQRKR